MTGPFFFFCFFFDRRPWRIYERSFCCRPRSKRKPIFLPLAWSLLAAHSVPLFISPPWKNRPTNWATSFQLVLSSFYRFFFLDFILIHLPNRPERYYLVICLFRSRYTSCYCFFSNFIDFPVILLSIYFKKWSFSFKIREFISSNYLFVTSHSFITLKINYFLLFPVSPLLSYIHVMLDFYPMVFSQYVLSGFSLALLSFFLLVYESIVCVNS